MKELDKSKKYDLSKLNNEQLEEFYDKYYKKRNSFDVFKKRINGFHFMYIDDCDYWEFNSNKFKHDFTITCATELFEPTIPSLEELIGKKVKGFKFNSEGFKLRYTDLMDMYINKIGEIIDVCNIFECCKVKFNNGETWSYPTELIKKQLELQYEVTMIAEASKPQHYANGIDTFERMEANCTIDECLAFAKGNIDKYNFRKKGQDLEDYTKIIAYANWAIKLLNKK